MAILDSITRVDVFVIFVEAVNTIARKCKINGETPTLPECFFRVCLNVAGRDSRVEVAGAGAGKGRGCGCG